MSPGPSTAKVTDVIDDDSDALLQSVPDETTSLLTKVRSYEATGTAEVGPLPEPREDSDSDDEDEDFDKPRIPGVRIELILPALCIGVRARPSFYP